MGYAMGRTFVRLPQSLPAAMRQQFEEAGYTIDEANGFAERLEKGQCDPEQHESHPLGDAFEHIGYVGLQSNVNMFTFSHWRRGKRVRHLVSAGEWVTIEGEPDAWEAEFLSSPNLLKQAEEVLIAEGFADDGERAQKLAELHRIYAAGLTGDRVRTNWPWCDEDIWVNSVPNLALKHWISDPQAEKRAELGHKRAELGHKITDTGLSDQERYVAVLEANKHFPNLVSELLRAGKIPIRPMPQDTRPWMSSCYTYDGESPITHDQIARTIAALSVDPVELATALEGEDKRQIMLAFELLETLAELAPESAGALEPKLRPLIRDGRTSEYGPGIPTERNVDGFFSTALKLHGRVYASSAAPWEALVDALEAACVLTKTPALSHHFARLETAKIAPERVAEWLIDQIGNTSWSAGGRARARHALTSLAENGGGLDGESRGKPWTEAAAFLKRADALVLKLFADPETEGELKARIQAAIPKWMPERATELLKKISVPTFEELLTDKHKDANGNFSPAQLDPADLLGLLRSAQADPSHLLAAIRLAVGFAQAHPGEKAAVEKGLREQIADNRSYDFHGRPYVIGVEALNAYVELTQNLDRSHYPSTEALRDFVADLIKKTPMPAPLQPEQGPDPEPRYRARPLLSQLRWLFAERADRDRLTALLLGLGGDRSLTGPARLHARHAFEQLDWDAKTDADGLLLVALVDPSEDPWLRAEAHLFLANRYAATLHALQTKGVLERPPVPPIEALVKVWSDGERGLLHHAMRVAAVTYPDDIVAALRELELDLPRALGAATLAPLVARRLPGSASALSEALKACEGFRTEYLTTLPSGREQRFVMADEAARARQAIEKA